MRIFTHKPLSLVALGFLFLALPGYGYQQSKPEPCNVRMKPPETPVKSQAREITIQVDNYLKSTHSGALISADDQQSVLWRCAGCTFRVVSLVPDLEEKGLPPDVRKHLEKFKERGPFYRGFPDSRDEVEKDRFFSKLASGPLLPDAAPKRPEGHYTFKATLWIKQGDKVCELDPHIITHGGLGP